MCVDMVISIDSIGLTYQPYHIMLTTLKVKHSDQFLKRFYSSIFSCFFNSFSFLSDITTLLCTPKMQFLRTKKNEMHYNPPQSKFDINNFLQLIKTYPKKKTLFEVKKKNLMRDFRLLLLHIYIQILFDCVGLCIYY